MPFPHRLPFDGKPFALRMNLRSCATDDWLELPEHYDGQMAERDRLLDERRPEVFQATPGSEAAGAEVLRMVVAHMLARQPGRFLREGHRLRDRVRGIVIDLGAAGRHPLDIAGRITAEDLCLMEAASPEARATGAYSLTAASLCFPSRWRLAEKIGRPLRAIHEPVHGFDAELARPVERVFSTLQTDRILQRINWSVLDDPALFQPVGRNRTAADRAITADNAGERLFVRMERQTLRRLPETGAVLFTIHLHVHALAEIAADPEAAADLLVQIGTMPDEHRAYKSVGVFGDALAAYLAGRAAAA
ncbi:heme-dependent oxidative N-demethylase family protein [Marinivivus vitaminiproducens]|uniref:heme-dependent oxidative N-demethylase family protein n=1 Tax=Marinivivus vitaminiproducens TaxID=3035935 RepID=UPI0027A98681|nr:DUF3445 domain-containing protein [Geminicoccaceae bacterium SCSIO 64248]